MSIPPAPGFSETVVHLATEYWPYARTGGLAEAVRGIARHQSGSGVPTRVILPLYREIRQAFPWIEPAFDVRVRVGSRSETGTVYEVPAARGYPSVYFVANREYFERPELYGENGGAYPDNHLRFAFFCRAALAALPRISPGPTLIHGHDWQTALALIYLRTTLAGDPYFDAISTVMTVHNAAFQGYYPRDVMLEVELDPLHFHWRFLEWYGQLNLLKGALVCADMVTTVSPTHARELRTRDGGFGLHSTFDTLLNRFVGVLNGIESDLWNPADDPELLTPFGPDDLSGKESCKAALQQECGFPPEPRKPVLGMSARLVKQKGLDLILADDLVRDLDAQWVFLGHGDPYYHSRLESLARELPDRVNVRFDFTEEFEHRLLGGADLLLMPSLYEPCGITQMRAQRYGALPVARRVGGLADTIEDRVTGFLFDEYEPWALREALQAALTLYADTEAWRDHVRQAMVRDFGWDRSVAQYHEVYHRAIRRRAEKPPLP
ncbi:MAG TPA: glycogen/starch synthase [Longimicrobiales bacterium]|nr:glycogen/starch synthase [Longimicrobiales bacterium]